MAIAKRLTEGERIVFHTRTHIKVLIVPALVLLITVPAAAFLATVTENDVRSFQPVVVLRDGQELTLSVTPGPWTHPEEGTQFPMGFGFGYAPVVRQVPANPR